MPLVSVIMPTFDGARFVGEAVESVLAQTHGDLELIVCDDGSTDGTQAIVDGFADRVRRVASRGRGVSAARNAAAATARGEYLAFLDQDDAWEPTMLATQLTRFAERPDSGLAYADAWIVDAGGAIHGRRSEHLAYAEGDVFAQLLVANCVPIETIVMRRALFERLGGFDERYSLLEDHDLCLRVAREAPLAFTPEPLARYRVHDRNLSHDLEGILREHVAILDDWLARRDSLTAREVDVAERSRATRRAELAWHALRRLDVEDAERWVADGGTRGGRRRLRLKVSTLLGLTRLLPRPLVTRLVAALPERSLYGVVPRRGAPSSAPRTGGQ